MKPLDDIIRSLCPPLDPLPTDTQPIRNKLTGIKAVIFDVYGTLFISGSGDVGTAAATHTAAALTQALTLSGFQGDLDRAGKVGRMLLQDEIREWHAASRAAGIDFPEVDIAKVWKRILYRLRKDGILNSSGMDIEPVRQLGLEYECRVNPVWPMPECLQMLHALKERGFTLGIVSNAQFYTPLLFSAFFERTAEELGFDPDCCIWSYKELKAKPSADLFPKLEKNLARNHGISLAESVYVGNDMLNDVYCAGRAGCQTVLFAGDRRSLRLRDTEERCLDIEPNAIITSLSQLLDLI